MLVQSQDQEHPLEKIIATHSNILAWRIPWTEEPGGLQSIGLQRVGHDWVTEPQTVSREAGVCLVEFGWSGVCGHS